MQTFSTYLPQPSIYVTMGHRFCRSYRPLIVLATVLVTLMGPPCAGAAPALAPSAGGAVWRPPQSELIYEGMASFGNYRLFGAVEDAKLYTAGAEYDRELRLRILRARVDYVSEFLPVVLLSQRANADFWGNPLSSNQKTVPGMGITPLGFRLLWRDGRRLMPYFDTKATVLGFTQKALSPDATYENWSFHCTGGLKLKLGGRYDLRLGMLSDLHFSNAFIVRSNPGVDFMNVSVAIVYHLNGWRASH